MASSILSLRPRTKIWHPPLTQTVSQGLEIAEGCLRFVISEAATEEGLSVVLAKAPRAHSNLRVRVLGGLSKKSQVWLVATIICSRRRRPVLPALRMFSQHLREDGRDVGRNFTKALGYSQPAADEALIEELQTVRESMFLCLGPGRPFATDSV